jgi:hypothetical protein
MCVLILFNSCWALFSWSHKSRISDSSPVEGAHLSVTITVDPPAEDLPTISYEGVQSSDSVRAPCKIHSYTKFNKRGHIVIEEFMKKVDDITNSKIRTIRP